MQAKKAKQLLKARLCRERQIYEMRKRSELKAAVSELERPWEVVERAPNLFSVSADEQLKVLADRFQKPGGFDLWTENDGPQLFQTPDELPSARFFPKGVVHSVKPYRRVSETEELESGAQDYADFGEQRNRNDDYGELSDVESLNSKISSRMRRKGNGRDSGFSDSNGLALSDSEQFSLEELDLEAGNHGQLGEERNRNNRRSYGRKFRDQSRSFSGGEIKNGGLSEPESLNSKNSLGLRRKTSRRRFQSSDSRSSGLSNPGLSRFDRNQRGKSANFRRSGGYSSSKMNDSENDVYDMSLQQDGRYELQPKNGR